MQALLLDWIKNMNEDKFSSKILFMHGEGVLMPLYEEAGIKSVTLSKSKWNPLIPLKLILTLYKEKPDILVVQQEVMAVMGSIAGWVMRVPAVIVMVPYTKSQVRGWIYRTLRIAAIFSDQLLSQTSKCTEELLSIGIPNEKIRTIPFGTSFPDNITESEKTALRKELGLEADDLVLFSAARLHKQKGHSLLLDMFWEVMVAVPGTKLLIAGSGPEEARLKRKAKKIKFGECVKFLGYRTDVKQLLNIVDVNVLPSLVEGLGVATMHALGMGIPIVAFDVGAVSEAVIHNKTGCLLEEGDVNGFTEALIDLLQNPSKVEEFGQNAIALANEKYSIKKSVEAMEEVFLTLFKKKRSRLRPALMVMEDQKPELTTVSKN